MLESYEMKARAVNRALLDLEGSVSDLSAYELNAIRNNPILIGKAKDTKNDFYLFFVMKSRDHLYLNKFFCYEDDTANTQLGRGHIQQYPLSAMRDLRETADFDLIPPRAFLQ